MLPTTLLGRHPGWGPPGGGGVKTEILRDVWDGVKSQDIAFDAVLTGYMGEAGHIELGADIIDHVKSKTANAIIAVDPVMGDHGRLYIPETRAESLISALVPKADFITPNLWELDYIESRAKRLPARLITSAPHQDKIGAI